jgi:hypothetical protein
MTAFPTTADLQSRLRRLAEIEEFDLPILSIYLDMRPQATGQAPGRRAALVVLRDRLRDIERTYWPRGPDFDSFESDRERLLAYLDGEFDPAAQGLAVFACSAIGLWEAVESGVPFDDSVSAGPRPDLFQLARLIDTHETAVVALVDSNSARLFVTRTGRLEERQGPDERPDSFRKRSLGGWSQARYQRHIDKHIKDFARESAAAIEELVDRQGARRLVLAGEEVAITPLLDALTPRIRAQVDDVLRIDMRESLEELNDEVRGALERAEAESGASVVDQLIAAVRSGGLGAIGADATRRALEAGQVALLVLSDVPERTQAATPGEPELNLELRNELVRLAIATSAEVEVVADNPTLERAGGVGALLRYRAD